MTAALRPLFSASRHTIWYGCLFCALLIGGAWGLAYAQSANDPSAPLELFEDHHPLAPAAVIYTNLKGDNSVASVIKRYQSGDRPKASHDNIIALSSTTRPEPFWLVIPMTNQADHTEWLLDFGDRLRGRNGQFNGVLIYDYTTRQVLYSSSRGDQELGIPRTVLPKGNVIPLSLPKAQESILMVYLQPHDTSALTFPLDLERDSLAQHQNLPLWQRTEAHMSIIALCIGFLLALSLTNGQAPLFFGAGYIASLALPSIIFPMPTFIKPDDLPFPTEHVALSLGNILLLTLFWLHRAEGRFARHSDVAAIFGIGISVVTAMLPILPMANTATDGLAVIVTYVLIPATLLFIAMCNMSQSQMNGVILLAIALIHLGAALLMKLGLGQVLSIPVCLNANLFVALPQFLFLFILGLMQGDIAPRRTSERPSGRTIQDDPAPLSRLREVKENLDYNNLLKVIEHERKQLTEARARENERAEEMRRAKEAADEANRAKSAFLAVISHEIRTPMTGVMSMVKLLLDGNVTREQREYISTIKESGNAMMSLLNDILDFEKIESGKIQLEQIDFDLHRLAQSVVTLMQGHATTKNIQLKFDIALDVPRYVVGDMTRLRQVLLNLVGNAIKFTQRGAVTLYLNVNTDPEERDIEQSIYQVYFAVRDTGIGISPEAQKRIFDPFAQGDTSITRKFGGTGLGLAISRRLVEAMGGQINVNSRENEGTNFFFTLSMPRGNPELVEDTTQTESSTTATTATTGEREKSPLPMKYRVLVVEDNEITRRVLRPLLEQQSCTAVLTASGEEALEVLDKTPGINLVLTDLQMGGMSGLDLTRRIRAHKNPSIARLPVIALTGHVGPDTLEACRDAGVTAHLGKPIDPEQFESTLRNALSSSTATTETATKPEAATPDIKAGAPAPITIKETPIAPTRSAAPSTAPEQPPILQATLTQPPLNIPTPPTPTVPVIPPQPLTSPVAPATPISPTPSASSGDKPVFQPDMLATLKQSLGEDQMRDILVGLYEKGRSLIAELNDPDIPHQPSDIRDRAHELKGMCGNFGLMELSHIAQQIENAAKSGTIDAEIQSLIQSLDAHFNTGRHAIEAWLKS